MIFGSWSMETPGTFGVKNLLVLSGESGNEPRDSLNSPFQSRPFNLLVSLIWSILGKGPKRSTFISRSFGQVS